VAHPGTYVTGVPTRVLIALALICGVLIVVAFTIQTLLANH
jgi:hypothetical protein